MKDKIIAIPTQEISEIVQKKLFELGYYWDCHKSKIQTSPNNNYRENTYLQICKNDELVYADREYYFEDDSDEDVVEIDMYDLYQMKPINDSVVLTTEDGQKVEISRKSLEELKKLK